MKKQLFLTLVVALGFPLIMTLVMNHFIFGEPVESTTGSITREVWTGISGNSVSSIPLGAAPNITDTWWSFEAPTNWADNYGTRMRGYITAPATGDYTFWIAGENNCELLLSLNDNPATKVRIGLVSEWTDSRQWDKYSTQKSAAITLTQGQRYYVEALQKEGVGGDNLAVGWAKPGESTSAPSEVIPGSVLSPFSGGGSATTLSDNFTSTKKIIHWQSFSNSVFVSNVVANHTYIDTLPFDGIIVKFPDYQRCLGPNYIANYSTLYNQIGPIKNVLAKVKHNYANVLTGNTGMVDPFDDWTQAQANFVILALVCRDAGLEGIFLDTEEYNVHWWRYPNDCKYASTKTVSQYQEQWRLRGTQVMQAIIAQWPQAKIVFPIDPFYSSSRFGGPNWLGGFFAMGMFAAAPGHMINGGERYQERTAGDFSNWLNFMKVTLTQPPNSPPLIPSGLTSTWQSQMNQSFGIYDQDKYGTPVMSYSVLQSTIVNAMPYANEFVWNYSGNLDWLTPGAGSGGNWQNAVWNARRQLGLPSP
jgi:hypothetical protein